MRGCVEAPEDGQDRRCGRCKGKREGEVRG
jgi:hypothetical protein